MSAESTLPPIAPTADAGSHSRYSCSSGWSPKIAGMGAGTQPDSRLAVE